MKTGEKRKSRKRMRGVREKETIRDALMLRKRTPEESLRIMLEMCEFVEKLNRVEKY